MLLESCYLLRIHGDHGTERVKIARVQLRGCVDAISKMCARNSRYLIGIFDIDGRIISLFTICNSCIQVTFFLLAVFLKINRLVTSLLTLVTFC